MISDKSLAVLKLLGFTKDRSYILKEVYCSKIRNILVYVSIYNNLANEKSNRFEISVNRLANKMLETSDFNEVIKFISTVDSTTQ